MRRTKSQAGSQRPVFRVDSAESPNAGAKIPGAAADGARIGEKAKARSEHCWHRDNIVLTSNPPQYPETCCHCGGKRRVTHWPKQDPKHGPHVASYEYEQIIIGGDAPCQPTQ